MKQLLPMMLQMGLLLQLKQDEVEASSSSIFSSS